MKILGQSMEPDTVILELHASEFAPLRDLAQELIRGKYPQGEDHYQEAWQRACTLIGALVEVLKRDTFTREAVKELIFVARKT